MSTGPSICLSLSGRFAATAAGMPNSEDPEHRLRRQDRQARYVNIARICPELLDEHLNDQSDATIRGER